VKRVLFFLALLLPFAAWAQVEVATMRTNGLERPIGVSPKEAPVLSWIVKSQSSNALQTAYEVIVTTNGRKVWSSVQMVVCRWL
jgi:hypothetical protein